MSGLLVDEVSSGSGTVGVACNSAERSASCTGQARGPGSLGFTLGIFSFNLAAAVRSRIDISRVCASGHFESAIASFSCRSTEKNHVGHHMTHDKHRASPSPSFWSDPPEVRSMIAKACAALLLVPGFIDKAFFLTRQDLKPWPLTW